MIVYAVVVLIIIILRLSLDNSLVGDPEYATETGYVKIVCGILVLLSALRGSSVGTDTVIYVSDYEHFLPSASFWDISNKYETSVFYYYLCKVFVMTGLSIHWWFGLVCAFYLYAFYEFIRKYSTDKLVSLLCFFTIGLYSFSLAGQKQTAAMGSMLLAFVALADRKYVKMVIFAVLAFMFHRSSSIFTFGLIVYAFRNRKGFLAVLAVFLVVSFFFGDWLWKSSIGLLNDEHYTTLYGESDNIYSAWTFVFYVLLFALSLFGIKEYLENDAESAKILYGMSLLALSFQSLATSYSTAFRVAYFFIPFTCVLIPNCCDIIGDDGRRKRMLKIFFCALCVFWCLYTGRENVFTFFWNDWSTI